MAITDHDVDALLDIVLVYIPAPHVRQFLRDVEMSRAAEHDPNGLQRVMRRLIARFDKNATKKGG